MYFIVIMWGPDFAHLLVKCDMMSGPVFSTTKDIVGFELVQIHPWLSRPIRSVGEYGFGML